MDTKKEWIKWACVNPDCKLIVWARPEAFPKCWFCKIDMIEIEEIKETNSVLLT